MVKKLSEPSFEPVYALDRSIDTILGYDHLQDEVQTISAEFSRDEHGHYVWKNISERELSRVLG